jgi:hypothetical protein
VKLFCILMTSRSGSSLVADCFVRHGFGWASNPKRNPQVGRKVIYRSFENQVVKEHLRAEFGMPLGDPVVPDDDQVRDFERLLDEEYSGIAFMNGAAVWKGAVEFYPLWKALPDRFEVMPVVVLRNQADVIESVLAKRGGGRGKEAEARRITAKRFELLEGIASDDAVPVVLPDELIGGKLDSLRQAFEYYDYSMDENAVRAAIKPEKWKADR